RRRGGAAWRRGQDGRVPGDLGPLMRRRRTGPPFWHDFEFDHDHDDHPDGAGGWDGPISKNDFYYADNVELTTVGIDIGSSTSHLMFSRLHLQRLGQYLSSRYVVVKREMLHRSPILLTPYRADNTIDANALDAFLQQAYDEAGMTPADIDSGAIILTGEAIKRTNARAVADLFADHAGKFVCASAGHNLEAILAANGSGALELSRHPTQTVLNVDVGGGTSKLALVRGGQVLETAAINVGGRLVAFDTDGQVTRIEPSARVVADSLGIDLRLGEPLSRANRDRLADALAGCLFETIRRDPLGALASTLLLTPPLTSEQPIDLITFSGGVAEYLYDPTTEEFGDLARPLADAVRTRVEQHALPAALEPAGERIRATVIGASQFTVQVSGNTIAITRPDLLPIHNIQVLYPHLPDGEQIEPHELSAAIQRSFQRFDLQEGEQVVAIAIDWTGEPRYSLLRKIAAGIVQALPNTIAAGLPLVLVFAHDFGKLIGSIIREDFLQLNDDNTAADIISLDGIELQEFDYIDIGEMIYPAQVVPVVVKSLVFPEVHGPRAEMADRVPASAGESTGHGR
ncbi:MAG TPA: ethanolamine ammonia-lyase reactivating factor EutA, partial [Chloroflexota bacterium]|nr:ethanolamine ammonia-lyase reactivating factor EutA [Chloroflexota bacterium]